ncbi:Pentatricopeptide repeat-containing protein [Platanthera zijinensis]|uniref:Pentatricopeptide repeat-containing protein n=1 Tax=Platanthera zijinensis TaxID=2320716 RepID=A0AAP0AUP6_9ASPA
MARQTHRSPQLAGVPSLTAVITTMGGCKSWSGAIDRLRPTHAGSGRSLPTTDRHHTDAQCPSSGSATHDCITLFKSPSLGYQIHSNIIVSGFANDSFLSTKLINFYSLCGDLPSALAVFELFPTCNVYLLNSMIRGYSSNGFCQKAINLFRMKRGEEASIPDSYTFICAMKACASALDLRQGKQLHQIAVECGFGADIFISNSLIFMYAKCGSLEGAVHVFDEMPHRDIVSWNSVILAFALNGLHFDVAEMTR